MKENSKSTRVKITVLLDDKTLNKLRAYGYETLGKTNVSQSIMSMVNKYETKKQNTDRED